MRTRIFFAGLISALAFTLSPNGFARAMPELAESAAWGVVPSPNAGHDPGNVLNAIDVLTNTDAWAVGSYGDLINPRPQVQHWDGTGWRQVAIPANVGEGELFAVAAVSADDVWIAGGYQNNGRSLILHWDGASLSVVRNPNPGTFNRLYGLTALAANDVWAVGETVSGISRPLIEHWDGSTWRVVPSPTNANSYTTLYGIDAVSANDLWAVGDSGNHAFALHWTGDRWQRVSTQALGSYSSLRGVSAVSADDVWAVGDGLAGSLTTHWNGSDWALVPSPHIGDTLEELDGVSALASDDVWAVGFADAAGAFFTFTLHWNGGAWSRVPSANTDPTINILHAVDAVAADSVWAVGEGDGTLVERWNGAQWTVVASSNLGVAANDLLGISALTETEIWAVGHAGTDSLTERWNGSEWTVVPSPNTEFGAPLEDVVAIAADDAWGVGSSGTAGGLDSRSIAMHWDGNAWTIVPTPQPGGPSVDRLWAVDAVSPGNVYAVGEYWDARLRVRPLILQWNGADWVVVPNACAAVGALQGIDALSATDIWAVGEQTSCHYDGATWMAVPIDPSGGGDLLRDVTVIAPNDAWTVGQSTFCFAKGCETVAYAAHWDGVRWRMSPIPGVTLGGVIGLSSTEVWAAGTFSVGALITHWNGSAWVEVPTPDPDEGGNLNDIDAVSPAMLWAAGNYYTDDFVTRTLIEQAPSTTQGAVVGTTRVAGASVTWVGPVSGSTTTDSSGAYSAAGLLAGSYTFVAAQDGCTPAIAQVTVIAGTTVTQNLRPDCR
jgi:hypothetical protein